jgi:glycosyltransferase involved in cell wall biosynthesis
MGEKKKDWIDRLQEKIRVNMPDNPQKMAIIIPTFNSEQSLKRTLDSIAHQGYEPLEVLIIDAGSTDHTLTVARSYGTLVKRVYTVGALKLAPMLNRGLSLIDSPYVSVLFPGTRFVSSQVLKRLAAEIDRDSKLDLIFFPYIQNRPNQSVRYVYPNFSLESCQKDLTLPSLSACLISHAAFSHIGKFDERFNLRPDYDWLIRFLQEKSLRYHYVENFFVDVDLSFYKDLESLELYRAETSKILFKNFPINLWVKWFLFGKKARTLTSQSN